MERLVITAKDIQIITGKSERYGREKIAQIKSKINKQPHQFLTIEEYCNYSGFEVEKVLIVLKLKKNKQQ